MIKIEFKNDKIKATMSIRDLGVAKGCKFSPETCTKRKYLVEYEKAGHPRISFQIEHDRKYGFEVLVAQALLELKKSELGSLYVAKKDKVEAFVEL